MAKYECSACGYIYDEEAEGTKWEDLPDDWVCPVSGNLPISAWYAVSIKVSSKRYQIKSL